MTTHTKGNIPRVILGAMTFGLDSTSSETSACKVRGPQNVAPFLNTLTSHGHIEVDTARVYGNGDSEIVLSQLPELTAHLKIATKVFPYEAGILNKVNLPKQFRESLKALNASKVDIFYLHAPDYSVPLEETCKAVDDLYKEGLFERFGLSNYASWQVAYIHGICSQNNYVLPTVYQGPYNPIERGVVPELLPCLKHFNMSFYAYNPICGGILSGKYRFDHVPEGSRYDSDTPLGNMVRGWYWNKANLEAVASLTQVATTHNLTLLEATLRWMRHHSGLTARDGILIGASTVAQLEESLTELDKGPLPEEMIKAFDDAWDHVKLFSRPYFRAENADAVPILKKD
ncbi:Aflatoxin B1 aldehyde reductase member 2 [Linnemannia exigua]|uniref:Aflatoxin B1 aldehyde reductase member 2 n=1 Tax=Linnemannia exigua TaxID=604196 RepID=A0AAD4DF52_9FUNG|nr:Aflatoxin B1 aldehyde reductase member 2 [Linnemannia exigua]